MRCVVLFYFGWLIIFTNAQAASFDCLNAASQQEKLICANEELSVLDSTLNAAYKNALSNRDVPGVKQITVEQNRGVLDSGIQLRRWRRQRSQPMSHDPATWLHRCSPYAECRGDSTYRRRLWQLR